MAEHCQICHRPMEGAAGAGEADPSMWELAQAFGVKFESGARICGDCLQRYMKGAAGMGIEDAAGGNCQSTLAAAWREVFVSEASLPVGVLDLGHVSGYSRLFLPNFDAEIVRAEYCATSLVKNLALARRGDAVYNFRVRLTGAGNSVLISASGCAVRTGKKTPALAAAWNLLDKGGKQG